MGSSPSAKKPAKLLWCAVVLFAALILLDVSLSIKAMGDYTPGGAVGGANAGPGIYALLGGNLSGYVLHQPAIGMTSILLRLPLVGAGRALGSGDLLTYQLGVFACLLPLACLAAWLVTARTSAGVGRLAGLLAALVLLLSPVLRSAIEWGHPEEVLTSVLATGSVILAIKGHVRWAAVSLGLAVGSEPWGLIALAPVLIALSERRLQALGIAAGVAAVMCATPVLVDPSAFARALHGEGSTNLVNPLSVWWPVSSSFHLASGQLAPARMLPFGLSRAQSSMLGLAVVVPVLAIAWARARRRSAGLDPLALLVLLALARVACDSTHIEYYYLAVLVPLTVWEAMTLERLPLLALITTAAVALIPQADALGDSAALWLVSVGWMVLLGWYLGRHAFHEARSTALAQTGAGRRGPVRAT